jgi:hypothetical protein
VSNPPAEKAPLPGTNPPGKRAWLGKLSTYLASFAGGAAVNDLSGTLGYQGLAGAIALLGVVTAATWIRGLDPRARLPRRAPWLFLAPAACMATAAAFSSGAAASILTAAAAILTVGAVLVAKELRSATKLLIGAALIMGGAAVIAGSTASIANGNTPLGAAILPSGAAFIVAGISHIGERDTLAGAAVTAAGVALIAAGAAVIATGAPIPALGAGPPGLIVIFMLGAFLIGEGPVLIAGGRRQRAAERYSARLKRAGVEATALSVGLYAAFTSALGGRETRNTRRFRFSPLYAATIAGATSAIVNGPTKATKGVTQAGTWHIASPDPLVWPAIIAVLTAEAAFFALLIGPRTIATRIQRAIDWAIKAPQATRDLGTQDGPNGNVPKQS